jgi:HK97 family phage prohead protease
MSDTPEKGAAVDAARENGGPPRDVIRAIPPAVGLRAADDGDDQRPVLFGHFARFNEWTEIDSYFEGHFMERIVPGAFKKTFRERADQIRVLFQHGRDAELRDRPIGQPEELREDDEGAYHESRLFDGLPELIMEGLRAGQYGQSFKMEILREDFIKEPGVSDGNPGGLPERSIKEVRLFEYGPVTFPAYANTTPGVRSLTDDFVFDWLAREPQRARELIGAVDLSRAAFAAAETTQDPAPSPTDAAPQRTSVPERRDHPNKGRYGLTHPDPRPTWAL